MVCLFCACSQITPTYEYEGGGDLLSQPSFGEISVTISQTAHLFQAPPDREWLVKANKAMK